MTPLVRFVLAAGILLSVSFVSPNIARAQRLSAAARSSAAPAHARPVATHAIVSHSTIARSASTAARATGVRTSANAFTFGDGSFLSRQDVLNPVPGLGFDFPYLAAMNRDFAIKAVIDPVTQWQLTVAERLLRDTRGSAPSAGFFFLDGGGAYMLPAESAPVEQLQPQPQPQIIIVQQPPAESPSSAPPAPAAALDAVPPLPDIGQFVLALRNGTQIQAVAFTLLKDRIIYITADGSRRMIPASDLDPGATTLINEELGTPLDLPL